MYKQSIDYFPMINNNFKIDPQMAAISLFYGEQLHQVHSDYSSTARGGETAIFLAEIQNRGRG